MTPARRTRRTKPRVRASNPRGLVPGDDARGGGVPADGDAGAGANAARTGPSASVDAHSRGVAHARTAAMASSRETANVARFAFSSRCAFEGFDTLDDPNASSASTTRSASSTTRSASRRPDPFRSSVDARLRLRSARRVASSAAARSFGAVVTRRCASFRRTTRRRDAHASLPRRPSSSNLRRSRRAARRERGERGDAEESAVVASFARGFESGFGFPSARSRRRRLRRRCQSLARVERRFERLPGNSSHAPEAKTTRCAKPSTRGVIRLWTFSRMLSAGVTAAAQSVVTERASSAMNVAKRASTSSTGRSRDGDGDEDEPPRDGARADGGFGAFPTGEEVVGEGEEASLDGGGELDLAEVAEGAEGAARGVDVGANASRDAVDVGGDAAVDDASDAREETRAEVAHDGDEHPVDVLFAAELGGGAQLERAQRLGDRVRGLALATRVALAGAHEIPRLELRSARPRRASRVRRRRRVPAGGPSSTRADAPRGRRSRPGARGDRRGRTARKPPAFEASARRVPSEEPFREMTRRTSGAVIGTTHDHITLGFVLTDTTSEYSPWRPRAGWFDRENQSMSMNAASRPARSAVFQSPSKMFPCGSVFTRARAILGIPLPKISLFEPGRGATRAQISRHDSQIGSEDGDFFGERVNASRCYQKRGTPSRQKTCRTRLNLPPRYAASFRPRTRACHARPSGGPPARRRRRDSAPFRWTWRRRRKMTAR